MESGLFKTVVQATGLPETPISKELESLVTKKGFNSEDLTLDELREVMAEYLNTVFLEMLEDSDENSASA